MRPYHSEYLGHLVDAVLFTHSLKPFPKGNFLSLGEVHEGLLAGSPLLHSFMRD